MPLPQKNRYTLANALAWDEQDRIELIDGCPVMMAPSTTRHDRFTKCNLYQRAGVREYWIVDPAGKSVQVFALEEGRYTAKDFGAASDRLRVNILEDGTIDLSQVLPE